MAVAGEEAVRGFIVQARQSDGTAAAERGPDLDRDAAGGVIVRVPGDQLPVI